MEKVSVIVPVYNAENYISDCIETLIQQTYSNIEIVIINDGSTDESYRICKQYEKIDDRIKLINIENSGVSIARNIGIENSTGNYLTFVDSDDWIELNMIEFAINKAKEDNADIVIWSYFKSFKDRELKLPLVAKTDADFTNDKSILIYKSIDSMYQQDKNIQTVSAGTTWCKLYKKSLIVENNIKFNPILTRAQDTIFSIKAFIQAKKIMYYNESLYHYRITNTSTSSGTRFIPDTLTPFNALLEEFARFKSCVNDKAEFTKVFNIRVTKVLLWHLEHNYFHQKYRGNIMKRKKEVLNLINLDFYKFALKNVDYSELPKKERAMVKFLKRKRILTFYIIYKLHGIVVKLKTKKLIRK